MKIVMYHYVRDYKSTRFPNIKGLDVKDFEFQISYLKSKYNILNPKKVHEIIKLKKEFSTNDCWLTFDDGYIDHYNYVLPILERNKIKASFFCPAKTTLNETVLDVNKIHFILAKNKNYDAILNEINGIFSKSSHREKFHDIIRKIDTESRFDDTNVMLIKKLLQSVLPNPTRSDICDFLFKKYVSQDIPLFAKSLYMNISHLSEINKLGHEIGLHGYDHVRLGNLTRKDQKDEILKSLNFLKKNNLIDNSFTMNYPYGHYNADTLNILNEVNCLVAITTVPKTVPLKNYNALELPRLDTNDFPKNRSEVNKKNL